MGLRVDRIDEQRYNSTIVGHTIRRAVIMSRSKKKNKANKKSRRGSKIKAKRSASQNMKKRMWKHQGR